MGCRLLEPKKEVTRPCELPRGTERFLATAPGRDDWIGAKPLGVGTTVGPSTVDVEVVVVNSVEVMVNVGMLEVEIVVVNAVDVIVSFAREC